MLGDDEILDGGNCVSENLASIDEIANLPESVHVQFVRRYEAVLCEPCPCCSMVLEIGEVDTTESEQVLSLYVLLMLLICPSVWEFRDLRS